MAKSSWVTSSAAFFFAAAVIAPALAQSKGAVRLVGQRQTFDVEFVRQQKVTP